MSVTTQAHEGIETPYTDFHNLNLDVTTQAHEGIETTVESGTPTQIVRNNSSPWGHWNTISKQKLQQQEE